MKKNQQVDEGIEAMLCCWLQQLQEFGGPEVEKPDLLQDSIGSLRPQRQASSSSLARHYFNDPRARYNVSTIFRFFLIFILLFFRAHFSNFFQRMFAMNFPIIF